MRAFDYIAPGTMGSSLHVLQSTKAARLLAGGTDLVPLMKAGIAGPDMLVNVKTLQDLPRSIEAQTHAFRLGALVTLADIEQHPVLAAEHPVLAQAAASAATPQLRNMATLGGTLMQRPRCWYFRNERFNCWLKGGDHCPAREGENAFHAIFDTGPCCAVHPSDVACALLALGAQIEIHGVAGSRVVAIDEFFVPPDAARRAETLLGRAEIVTAIRIPRAGPGVRSVYLKAMDRAAWAFALVSAAAVVRVAGETIEDIRLVLGGVASVPWSLTAAAQTLKGTRATAEQIAALAEAALDGAQALRKNGYKVPLAKGLIRRALAALAPDQS